MSADHMATPETRKTPVKFNPRQWLMIAAAVVVVAAAAIYFVVSRPQTVITDAANSPAATTGGAAANSEMMIAGPLGDMTLGDPKAPNVVIEYASMTCTHCQRFHQDVYRPFKAKYIDTGKVYFIFRDYPLDPLAAAAIVVAHCGPKERFFPLVDLMFDHQSDWAFVQDPVAALQNLVKQAGVSEETFKGCLTNQPLLDGVNWVKDRGEKQFGVSATPTFFINGTKYSGEQTLADLDKVLGGTS
jgi:protein-disulfide isomerase